LIESAGGQIIKPMAGMFAFSLAFALPFGTFAFFPSLMNGLPKSGGWLNSVKVTLGFIELALAFKFLSMIDLIYHFGILDRHINIAIWITIAAFAGLYYLGKIRLPHDSPSEHISVFSMLTALVCFSFVVYLLPGMFGAPLKALSGVLPPTTTSSFDIAKVVRTQTQLVLEENKLAKPEAKGPKRKYADFLHLPHGLKGYFDYEEGLAAAKKLGKPVFIDFTGHSCANCRRMEDNVWVDPEVMAKLKNEFVMIALYCDESKLKPESEWYESTKDGRMKKSIGQQNLDFELTRFEKNAQPFYVLLDSKGKELVKPRGYTPNVGEYIDYLDAGLKEFKKRKG
jgi:thiol:disulfide interchange protein DsbD